MSVVPRSARSNTVSERFHIGKLSRCSLVLLVTLWTLLTTTAVGVPQARAADTDPAVTHHRTVFDDSAPAVPPDASGVTFQSSATPPDGNSTCDVDSGQWRYVRNRDNTVDSDIGNKVVEGQVVYSKLSSDDNPLNHDSRDRNILVYPDPAYWGMLAAPGNFQTGEPNEHGRIELEWEAAAMPAWVLPNQGDRVHVQGNYIFDCAHESYRTEIHPPRLVMTLRDAAQGWAGGNGGLAARPGWADTMPGLGSIPVQTTRADIFASSDGGEACDTIFCRHQDDPYNDAYQRLNDSNYDLFVPAPPKPDGDYQMIWTVDRRPLPSCFSDDSDCGMDDILANHPERIRFQQLTVGGKPGLGIHVDFAGYTPHTNGLYGFGFTAKVAWNKPADTPPRRVRVTLDSIYVANPMDGTPPTGCISTAEFCDGEFAIHTIIGDTFKHLRLCCASQDADDNVHQDVPYQEDINNYLYGVDGTSIYCGLASAGNPDGNRCQNSFQATLLPGQPLRVFLRGDEWEPITSFCDITGCGIDNLTNKDVGVVEHIFAGDPAAGNDVELSNYGIGGGPNHDGHYTEWFQEHLSAGDDNVNGYCTPPNGPCLNISYHIDDDPYPLPPTTAVAAVGSPSVTTSGATFVTRESTVTLKATAPDGRSGDAIELHARYWRDGTTPPGFTRCATGTGTATCDLHLTSNDGADGPYTVEYFSIDTTTGAISPTKRAPFTLDNTSPQTTLNFAGTPTRGWYNTLGPLTLSASDGPGVGVDHTTYSLDGGAATTYTGPFFFSGDSASHSVAYYSVDKLQNTEPTQTATFKIDTTPPELNITAASDGSFSYTQDELLGGMISNATSLTVGYTASDALSGLYQVRLDGQTLTSSSGTFTVPLPPGISSHNLLAEDVAGNLTTLTFMVAVISPVPGAAPQGIGFWRNAVPNQYTAGQFSDLLTIANLGSRAFGPPTHRYPDPSLSNYQTILSPGPTASMDTQLEAQLLAGWLNIAAGRLATAAPIDLSKIKDWGTIVTNTSGSPRTTALNLLRETERRLASNPTDSRLETAKNLLEALNLGKLAL
jgi:hypothetical protein